LGVLLACYYLFLEFDVWLIVGHGLLTGDTCQVLLKVNDEYFIVDPESGRKYSSKDIYLPLTKVYYLVNPYNVSYILGLPGNQL
jgi:coiled-coil and C2 domain-containing protein 2A